MLNYSETSPVKRENELCVGYNCNLISNQFRFDAV